MSEPRFAYLHVSASPEDAELASFELFELGADGVEERDATTLVKADAAAGVTLVASFPTEEAAREALAALEGEREARLEIVVGDAWRDAWKAHFRPFEVAPGLVVRPPWEPYQAAPGERVLELEPGRAFGTGLHETTSLVCGALAARAPRLEGRDVLDVGTGSGILALAALLLGAKHATCIDNDADVIPVVLENAARNGLEGRVDASARDLGEIAGVFPVVVANIEARVLVPMAPDLAAKVAPGGLLVLSGLLSHQEGEARAAYAGLEVEEVPRRGEWIALVLRAP